MTAKQHSEYLKARAAFLASPDSKPYVAAAPLIRAALKRHFPGVKFSVRSEQYAVNVSWTDGPTAAAVRAVVGVFASRDFDGSIDLTSYLSHWLFPDGSVSVASSSGTSGSGGCIEPVATDCPQPGAVLVSLSGGYVFCHRDLSPARESELRALAASRYGYTDEPEVAAYLFQPFADGRNVCEFIQMVEQS